MSHLFPLETQLMGKLLEDIFNTTEDLKLRFENLTNDISEVNQDLTNISMTSLNTGADFSSLPNVKKQLDNIADINEDNFAENATEVSLEALLVSDKISNRVCMCWF